MSVGNYKLDINDGCCEILCVLAQIIKMEKNVLRIMLSIYFFCGGNKLYSLCANTTQGNAAVM